MRVPELQRLTCVDGTLHVGAAVRQSAVLRSPEVQAHSPLIGAALRWVSHPAVRSRGTFGGSLAHADAQAELPAVCLALDAAFTITGPRGRRVVPAQEFFLGHYTTAVEPDELLTEIALPSGPAGATVHHAFQELARRHGDFALAGVGVRLTAGFDGRITDARIGLCGLGEAPLRAYEAERILVGSAVGDRAVAKEAAASAVRDLSPPADQHGSAAYRVRVAAVLVRRTILTAAAQGEAR